MIATAVSLTVLALAGMFFAFLAGIRVASPDPVFPPTQDSDPMSQAVQDAFSAYVAYRDQKETDAVAAAVAAEQANHQGELDAAKAAGATEEANEDVALITAATPVPVSTEQA